MNTRFRFVLLLLLTAALLGFSGCTAPGDTKNGSSDSDSAAATDNQGGAAGDQKQAALKVVTTVFAPSDFVSSIAGEYAEVSMLLPPGVDSHGFEPTPRDIIRIQQCDLFIYIGGESETWISEILDALDTSRVRVLRLMDCVSVLPEEIVEGMEADAEEGDGGAKSEVGGQPKEPEYDEHIWTSPQNATLMVKAISAALSELRPAQATGFAEKTSTYLKQLGQLDDALHEVVAAASRRTLVFGDRFPFRYLTDELGLSYYAAFPGCASETEPKPATVAFLVNKIRAEALPVVLKAEMSSAAIAQTIASETGAEVRTLHSLHNLSREDLDSGATYLSLMWSNVTTLKEALG